MKNINLHLEKTQELGSQKKKVLFKVCNMIRELTKSRSIYLLVFHTKYHIKKTCLVEISEVPVLEDIY